MSYLDEFFLTWFEPERVVINVKLNRVQAELRLSEATAALPSHMWCYKNTVLCTQDSVLIIWLSSSPSFCYEFEFGPVSIYLQIVASIF